MREHPDLAVDKLDVMVRYADRRNALNTKEHVCSGKLPDRSLYRLGDEEVYVASPELCLIQLATKLTEPEVTKLALEMCGGYAVDPLADDDDGLTKRPPLTSVKKLKAYASRLYAPNSRAQGVKFLRWVADGSASPRETALCMLLCMPPRFGGYGIALPVLNKRIELTYEEKAMVGANHFDCDLYWAAQRSEPTRRAESPRQAEPTQHAERAHHVAIEYDSARHHTAMEKQERDAIRRNMLQYKNIQVVTATRKQVNSASEFDKLARQVAREVGKRQRIPEKAHVRARETLRETLFTWDLFS